MKIFDIFKSEGGYRVCGAIWNSNPVIDRSPWYETLAEAESAQKSMMFKQDAQDVGVFQESENYWIAQIADEFYTANTKESACKIAIDYLLDFGWDLEYILSQRPDFTK